MTENERHHTHYILKESWLCLDFANTANWHASENPSESLTSYAAWVDWGLRVGLLSATEAKRLKEKAGAEPELAAKVLERAIQLREAIYQVFSAVTHRQVVKADALRALNAEWTKAAEHLKLLPDSEGVAWAWDIDKEALDWMLFPIARSAATLLTSPEIERVGQCADDRGCGWLFLDVSRNKSRRWCSMDNCGNRAKVMLHYERKRQEALATSEGA